MKKLISLFLAVMLVGTLVPVGAVSIDDYGATEDGWVYYTTGTQVTITAYTGTQLAVTVPSTMDGKPVTEIGEWAFRYASAESVVVPEGVTALGTGAFFGCSLETITLPSTLTEIGDRCFEGCTSLSAITIPGGVTRLGWNCFRLCTEMKTAVLPNTLTAIGEECFAYCFNLESVNLPDGLTEIGVSAFEECSLLPSPVFPAGLTSIGDRAYAYCTAISEVTIPAGVTHIGDKCFLLCDGITAFTVAEDNANYCSVKGLLYSKDQTVLIQIPFQDYYLTGVKIPEGVTTIASSAFYGCQITKGITIPATVTNIEPGAVAYCRNLVQIKVDEDNPAYCAVDGVLFSKDKTQLIQYPLGDDEREAYTVPAAVTEICDEAFRMADSLMSITFSAGLKKIGKYAFASCRIRSFTLPNGLEEIGEYAFYYDNQTTSFSLPDSVTYIGRKAFHSTGYYFDQSNWQNGLLFIGNHLIHCDTFYDQPVVLPESTASIAEEAFYDCYNLPSVTIPEGIEHLYADTFNDCIALQSVTLPSSLKTIGERTFAYCSNLTKISLKSVEKISDEAFFACDGLTTVKLGDSLTTLGTSAFENCTNLRRITIPAATEEIGENALRYCHWELVVLGYINSAAQNYAAAQDLPFVALDDLTFGDLSGDTAVNAGDALEALKAAVGKTRLDHTGVVAADVDNNLKVDAGDALLMLKKAVGKLDLFPVEE